MGKESSTINRQSLAALCGLYCGACVDYVEYRLATAANADAERAPVLNIEKAVTFTTVA